MKDLTAADLDAAVRTIAGSARSMGITVEGLKWRTTSSAPRPFWPKSIATRPIRSPGCPGAGQGMATAKFDESIDVAVNLGVDAKKSDQMVRGSVVLPAGTGQDRCVRGLCPGDEGRGCQGGGADIVGSMIWLPPSRPAT